MGDWQGIDRVELLLAVFVRSTPPRLDHVLVASLSFELESEVQKGYLIELPARGRPAAVVNVEIAVQSHKDRLTKRELRLDYSQQLGSLGDLNQLWKKGQLRLEAGCLPRNPPKVA